MGKIKYKSDEERMQALRDYHKNYYQKNKEQKIEYARKYNAEHRAPTGKARGRPPKLAGINPEPIDVAPADEQ